MAARDPVAVVGPGAIGSLLASRLAREAGAEVRLVGRNPRWLRLLRARGLQVAGPGRRAPRLSASALRPTLRPHGPPCDAVFVCVKSGDTAAALRRARPLVGPGTAVASLQNGLAHRGPILRAFGRARAVFGITYAAVERRSSVRIRHHGGDAILLAPHPGNATALSSVRTLLRRAGFRVGLAASEDRLLWTKTAFNAVANPVGALTACTNGALARRPALREIVVKAAREAAAAAAAAGHPPLARDLERFVLRGLALAPEQSNSMLQDLRAGRRTEADVILGPLLAAARRRRVGVPALGLLHRCVKRLERELAA